MRSSVSLLAGEPGIGKTTFLLSACSQVLEKNRDEVILFISSEESVEQVKLTTDRMSINIGDMSFLHTQSWQEIREEIRRINASIVIIDSIQKVYSHDIQARAGSQTQLIEVSNEIVSFAKANKVTCFITGHVTKIGEIAGPKLLEHIVDTVLYMNKASQQYVRAVEVRKNRFGEAHRKMSFQLKKSGIEHYKDTYRLQQYLDIGVSIGLSQELSVPGVREIHCLSIRNKGASRFISEYIDTKRLKLFTVLLEKYCGKSYESRDLFLGISGLESRYSESLDLAVLASLFASYEKKRLSPKLALIGWVHFSGKVSMGEFHMSTLRFLKDLGFEKVIVGRTEKPWQKKESEALQLEIVVISHMRELQGLDLLDSNQGIAV